MEPVVFTVLFQRPKDWIGRVVTWATGDEYSHSVVLMRGKIWSSQIPQVRSWKYEESPYHPTVRLSDRHSIVITKEQADIIERWLDSRVGTWYDVLALAGWLLHIPKLQWRNRFYCHEFCREPLEKVGLLTDVDELITARRLMNELAKIRNQ